jgi:uncharacterized membrane protein
MPDFWRKELWHPVTVHFPIALLLVATLLLVSSFFLRGEYKKVFLNTSTILLVIGSIGAWVGLYTGDLADGIVSRKICDPTVLKQHELAAQTMTYLFTGASAIQISLYFSFLSRLLARILPFIVLACMLAGSIFVVRTGHLGASVVYQQGGGVYKHSVDCDEFE